MKRKLILTAAFLYLTLTCFVFLLSGCSTIRTTMADASVPESEQCLIVVMNASGGWAWARLISIDNTVVDKVGERFYIPAGTHKLVFNTESWTTKQGSQNGQSVRIDTTEKAQIVVTETFWAEHTYLLRVTSASRVQLDNVTGSVKWEPPIISPTAPREGVLTDWDRPRGVYIIPHFQTGPYMQYTNLSGYDEVYDNYYWHYDWKEYVPYNDAKVIKDGRTGISPFLIGGYFQLGPEFGWDKVGLTTVAEVNLGVGLGRGLKGPNSDTIVLIWGYQFLAELYYYEAIGVGFGYGTTSIVPGLFTIPAEHYETIFPYFRFELLFFPETIVPLTLYGDYFFQHSAWAIGIRASFARKGEKIRPGRILE